MDQESLMWQIRYAVRKKVELYKKYPARYFMRSILAAVFLTLATTTSLLIAEYLETFLLAVFPGVEGIEASAYNLSKMIYALSFGWALVMILFMHSELFTSNVMYFSNQLVTKRVHWKKALKILTLCYIGNFVGAVLMSLLIVYSGTFTAPTSHFAEHIVMSKLTKTPMMIFLQGIIANMVVNIAVLLNLHIKGDAAKIFATICTVFVFAFFGSEHVIANFASFSLVGLATGFEGFTASAVLTNFLFATLGNIVGGGLCIGVVYAWLNKGAFKYKD